MTKARKHENPVPPWAQLGAKVQVTSNSPQSGPLSYDANVVEITASTVRVVITNPDADMTFPGSIPFSLSSQKRNGPDALSPRGWRTRTSGWISETRLVASDTTPEPAPEIFPEDYGTLFEASPIRPPKNEILKSAAKAAQEEPAAPADEIIDAEILYADSYVEGLHESIDALLDRRHEIRDHLIVKARNAAEDYISAPPGYQEHHLHELQKYRDAIRALNDLAHERNQDANIPF